MRETRVPFLVWEDFMRRRATKPMRHSYWNPNTLERVLDNQRNYSGEKPVHHNEEHAPAHHN